MLGFNDTSTLVCHFVSSPKGRKEIEEILEEMKERNRDTLVGGGGGGRGGEGGVT